MYLHSYSRCTFALFLLIFSTSIFAQSTITDQLEIDQQQAEFNNTELSDDLEPIAEEASSNSGILTEESATEIASGYEAITVYLDAKYGRRTKGAAKMMTELHKEWAVKGYRLQDVDLYTENADLRGFFITYVRE